MIATPARNSASGETGHGRNPDHSMASPLRDARDRGITPGGNPSAAGGACHASRGRTCPRCNGSIYRVERRFVDLLVSVLIPVHRYRCGEMGCSWEGNMRSTTDARAREGRAGRLGAGER
jgi:hypothetical protein